MKNVLFICSANVDRSKTAEDYFSENYQNYCFESAGTNRTICNEKGTNHIDQEFIDRADLVMVMEKKHENWIYKNLKPKNTRIVILEIEDIYTYYSSDLIEILEKKCAGLLQI